MLTEKTAQIVREIQEAQERYLLRFFGSEEAFLEHIDDFVLEEKTEFSPPSFDSFTDDYRIKILTQYRLRPKTEDEKEYDRRLSLLQDDACLADGVDAGLEGS